jgi:hypothetical protein
LRLEDLIETYDGPGGAIDDLRSTYQCRIRCDLEESLIFIQGMDEANVVKAGRSFVGIAAEMVTELSLFVKISLLGQPSSALYQTYVAMDRKVTLKSCLYHPPISQWRTNKTFTITRPKMWTCRQPAAESTPSVTEATIKRLGHYNRKLIVAGLERSLTNLSLAHKAVRMQVTFGEIGFIVYRSPQSGDPHHTLESFRKQMAKERTDLMLQEWVIPAALQPINSSVG